MGANLTELLESGLNPTDWLLPMLLVILGASFTYFYAIRLEDRRNRYNLKIKIYLEVLDQAQLLRSHMEDIKTLENLSKNSVNDKTIIDISEKVTGLHKSLLQHVAKIQIICSKDVWMCFLDFYSYSVKPEIDITIYLNKMEKLIKAMRKDLSGKEKELDWIKIN